MGRSITKSCSVEIVTPPTERQIHVACAIPNFYRAEQDPGYPVDDTLVHRGYTIANGLCTDFDAPGFGIEFNSQKLDTLKTRFDTKS